MNDELWAEAAADYDKMAREASLALADAELEAVMPFLLAARTPQEYVHRSALAQESIRSIAARCGIDEDDLMATARRRYELYRHALAEGQDPLQEVTDATHYNGSGPEKADEHSEGPDLSGDYAEVPYGGSGGPDPQVTHPRPPVTGPVHEATGSLRRQADSAPASAMTMPYQPMDTGTSPSVDTSLPSSSAAGMTPSLPAGVTTNNDDTVPITPPSIGQVTSSADPVRRKVLAVKAAVAESNPQLPDAECDRIARVVVGRYLRHADLTDSVVNNAPAGDGTQGSDSGSGGNGQGGLGTVVRHGLEWQGVKSLAGGAAELAAL